MILNFFRPSITALSEKYIVVLASDAATKERSTN
jgi:hypothetical protein